MTTGTKLAAFSWLVGQVLTAWNSIELGQKYGFATGFAVWAVLTILLDIRWKMDWRNVK